MDDAALRAAAERTDIFAKLTPAAESAHCDVPARATGTPWAFMGDGINDAAAMKAADVGISVDTAVDIARESADIILLEKDLMVLEQGVHRGPQDLRQHDQVHQDDGKLQLRQHVLGIGGERVSAVPAAGPAADPAC